VIDNAVWYLMRGSGVTALLLLTAVIVLGILTSRKTSLPTLPRFATMELHRSLSLLAVVFLTVHVLAAVLDPYAQVRLLDTVVPFVGSWQGLMLGLGTLSFDVFAAVIVSSVLLRHISRRVWRTIHWLGYGTWPLAFAHTFGTGSDSRTLWLRAIAATSVIAIAIALGWRVQRPLLRRTKTLSSAARRPTASAPVSTAASPRLDTSRRGG
jgi:sulfoxide reductase heme-binding subunit YedZ